MQAHLPVFYVGFSYSSTGRTCLRPRQTSSQQAVIAAAPQSVTHSR